jgi:ABC-2 type transport system permease protein
MIRKYWHFFWKDLRQEMSYKLSFALQIIGILPASAMFFFLSRMIGPSFEGPLAAYGGDYFPFVLIGIAFQSYLMYGLTSFSRSIRDAQVTGTLEALLVTPIRTSEFLLGSTAYGFVFNVVRIFFYLLFGSLIFSANFHWERLPLFLLILLLTIAAFSSLGLLSSSFILLFKRGDPVNWAINVLSWLLGGVYYPISVLPAWLQKVAQVIPMTHALEAVRACMISGSGFSGIANNLLVLLIWGALGLPLSFVLFRMALNRAKMSGTLGHY